MKIYLPESAAKKVGCGVRHLRRLAIAIGKMKTGEYNSLPMFSEKDIKAMKAAKGKLL